MCMDGYDIVMAIIGFPLTALILYSIVSGAVETNKSTKRLNKKKKGRK